MLESHVPDVTQSLQALIFDVDGTLYHQGMLRRRMAWRLLRSYALRPFRGLRTARILAAYRHGQERLRSSRERNGDLKLRQLQFAAEALRTDVTTVASSVAQWMEREPLPLLSACDRRSLKPLLELACSRGIKLGVLSDYPAQGKLAALGLERFFSVVVCAQDDEVQRFKPDPHGLQSVLRRLEVESSNAVYIGDRIDIDFATAQNAGVRCIILGSRHRVHPEGWLEIAGYDDLREMLFDE